MKKIIFFTVIIISSIFIIEFWLGFLHKRIHSNLTMKNLTNTNMTISSPAFKNNQFIPDVYTCQSLNINPPLSFNNIPKNTKSLILIVQDPDAVGGVFYHWIVYNISPQVTDIQENSVPDNSSQSVTSTGKPGYYGPCPPSGTHRYEFILYALDTMLTDTQGLTNASIIQSIQNHVLGKTQMIGLSSK